MNTLTIDFETYYDPEYSLSKMTTQEYIHDPRFEVIGVSVQKNEMPPVWFTGDHTDTAMFLGGYEWNKSLCIAHNAIFDGGILEHHFKLKPAKYFCTMLAVRPDVVPYTGFMGLAKVAEHFKLSEKGDYVNLAKCLHRADFTPATMRHYGEYCKQDTRLAYQIYKRLNYLPEDEKDLISLTVNKFTRPKLVLDTVLIKEALDKYNLESENIQVQAAVMCGIENFRQNEPFANFLRSKGIGPGLKVSPTTGKSVYAFAKPDPFMKELERHKDWEVELAWRARTNASSTITKTRLERFLRVAMLNAGFCIPLRYWGAHTGRMSGADGLNLQNLPRGSALRKAVRAPAGHKILACDYSQIEVRMVATLAGQVDMMQVFAEGRDVYREFGRILYKKKPEDLTDGERFIAKTAVLSLGYGAGSVRFCEALTSEGVKITLDEAQKIVEKYRETYSDIHDLWKELDMLIGSMNNDYYTTGPGGCKFGKGCVLMPNGMKLHYPGLKEDVKMTNKAGRDMYFHGWSYIKSGRHRTKIYGASFLENISQALSRIIMTDSELWLARNGLPAVLSVHDELMFVVPTPLVHKAQAVVEKAFLRGVDWMPAIPLACESAYGDTYADAK